MNLLVNATHAIEEKGTAYIRKGMLGNDFSFCEIEDTGLGLSLAYGIIGKHNGKIHVESELGKVTKFRIELPIKTLVIEDE